MQSHEFVSENTVFTHQQDGTIEEFHRSYDDAVEIVRNELGVAHSLVIGGTAVETGANFSVKSPGNVDHRPPYP